MRSLVKKVAEGVLGASGVSVLSRARLRSQVLVLSYHNILPDGEEPTGDRSLHLERRRFVQQLDEIQRHADVVPLAEALLAGRVARRPAVAITFDDAYRGAVRVGLAELAQRGLPATVFVCPGRLDGHSFWWDRFAKGEGLGAFRDLALTEGRGREELIEPLAEKMGLTASALSDDMTSASLDDLRAAVRADGIVLGGHTWTHPNLARATQEELHVELDDTVRWLRQEFGAAFTPYLAYPYGLSSPACEEAAARAGFEAGLRIEGGWFPPGTVGPFATPRMNVSSSVSTQGFKLRLSGVLRR